MHKHVRKKKEEKEKILGIIVGNSKIINQQDSDAVVKTNTVPGAMRAIL